MNRYDTNKFPGKPVDHEKILLVLLPFWDPLIPPLGISSLKSFLQRHGYKVKTVDVNIDKRLKETQNEYFACLIEYVPEEWRRHLYNVGHHVLESHMMAYINFKDEGEYIELVKVLTARTFFCKLNDMQAYRLHKIIAEFYHILETYFIDLLEAEKPAILGLSVYSGTLPASLFAFRLTKERYPHIKTVMGGGVFTDELEIDSPNFEYFLERTTFIDKIIVGEGELLFLKLLRGELTESQKVYTLADVDREIVDISSLEVPDFSDFDLSYYPQMASHTSRSCPFQCNFCVETTHWGTYRKKNTGQIVNELLELCIRHGNGLFLMCDSLLNPTITGLSEAIIRGDMPLYWGGYLRAGKDVSDMEKALLWRRGRFYQARLGVESGSQRILNAMDKKLDVEQIKASISSLAHAGIKTTTFWVIGYPGETEEDFQKTLDLIEELKDDIYEADCNAFWFSLTAQVGSSQLRRQYNPILLYPEKAKEMLIVQTWILDCEPSREKIYQRVNRFIGHCRQLKIPNPYSLYDIHKADERWKKLHKNAVPTLLEIKSNKVSANESQKVKNLALAENKLQNPGDWEF
jgi:radical SAM superfamily enzyme YgiQ (UPF0313 family)